MGSRNSYNYVQHLKMCVFCTLIEKKKNIVSEQNQGVLQNRPISQFLVIVLYNPTNTLKGVHNACKDQLLFHTP